MENLKLIENKNDDFTVISKKEIKKSKKYISSDSINYFNKLLKQTSKESFIKTYNNEVFNFKKDSIKQIIHAYKKNDIDWYLPNLLVMFANKKMKKNENFDSLLSVAKLVNLMVSKNTLNDNIFTNESVELLKNLILIEAKKNNELFMNKFLDVFNNLSASSKINSDYLDNYKDENMRMNWLITEKLFEICLNEVSESNVGFSSASKNISNYYSFREELQNYLKKKPNKRAKHTRKFFLNIETYNLISAEMMLCLDGLKKEIYFFDDWQQEEILSFVSELQIKAYLPDLPPMTLTDYFGLLIRYAILLFWALIIIYPVFVLIQQSFNANNTAVILNMQNVIFSTRSYKRLFGQTDYLIWITNSTVIAICSMIITIFIISITAYAFSRFKYRGKRAFLITLLVTQMVPAFTSIIVLFIIIQLLNISLAIPPIASLLIIYVGGGVASNTVILKGYMDSISQDIDDAARIDGCSHFWILARIIFPLCKPMLVLIALMSFIGPFGDVILPQILLTDPSTYTVAVGLNYFINGTVKNYASYFAGATLVAVPIVVLFLSLQKLIISGMSTGGVKG